VTAQDGATLVSTNQGGRLDSVSLKADVTIGANTSLTFTGTWVNRGVLTVNGGLGLAGTFTVANLGTIHGSAGGVYLFGTLDNTGTTLALTAATGSWILDGGTIHGGTITASGGATLRTDSSGGTLDGVTLAADMDVSANTSITFTGTWANRGVLTISGGTLNLGGAFTLANLGSFQHKGGVINVIGTLDNTNNVLNLNDTTGSFTLGGGTILGGTITVAGKGQLLVSSSTSRLSGVTFNGDMTLTSGLTVDNGLTFNGTLTLSNGFQSGALLFKGTQTLDGQAIVFIQSSIGGENALAVITNGDTLTLGPNVTVHGGGGSLGYSSTWNAATGIGLIIQGTVSADKAGQSITLAAASIDNQGTLIADGGKLILLHRDSGGGLLNEGLVFIGAGSTLTANAPYVQADGATFLSGGTLDAPLVDLQGGLLAGSGTVTGDVVNAARVEVGVKCVPGTLVIQGNYTQTADGTLALQIGGTDQGTGYDVLSVGGTATLDGTLEIRVLDGFFAQPGDTFTLLSAAQRQGEFAVIDGLNPAGQNVYFDPLYDDTSLTLVAVPYGGQPTLKPRDIQGGQGNAPASGQEGAPLVGAFAGWVSKSGDSTWTLPPNTI
jgi:hypothetical protein